jgi:putative zinc finger protein
MTCAEAEILICDDLDGTLTGARKAELQRHLADCAACRELARDAGLAVGFMERAAEVEPPPELMTKILFEQPWRRQQSWSAGARHWVRRLLQPVMQPKFAMGMAMTILSLSLLAHRVLPSGQWKPENFNPVKVWASLDDSIYRGWQRTVKFYDSIRFIYQIRARLQEWNQQQDEEQAAAAEQEQQKKADERRLPVDRPPAASPETPQRSR